MNPKVSIIITCYNYAHFLDESIQSALNQTFKNFEIIIVNDGSTDNTKQVLKKYENHPKIRIINQKNQGLARSRNNGIKNSKGEYILPLDADDMIHPEYLAKTVPVLNKNNSIGIAYTAFQFFGDINQIVQPINYDFQVLKFHGNYMTATSLFRKNAWEKAGGYNPNMKYGYEDWNLWISLGELGWKGKLINEPLFLYRQHGTSMRDNTHKNYDETIKTIINNHPEIYNKPIREKEWFEFKKYFENENRFPIGNNTTPNFQFYLNNIQFRKSKSPRVSIIIPCYNYAHFIEDAIRSALFQTYRNFEVIVINDGSTDNSKEVLMKYEDNPKINIIHQKNQGLAASRNNGIKEAKGEYILPLDADDIIHEKFLERTVQVFDKRKDIGIVYTYVVFFGDESRIIQPLEYNFENLKYQNQLNYCSLYKRDAWKEVGGYNTNMKYGYEDWDFWLSLGERGYLGYLLHEPLFFYRKHGKSMIDDAQEKHELLFNQIKLNHPNLYK